MREKGHRGCVLWFTGLSGAGKTTVSRLVAATLMELDYKVELLDGDIVRTHLSKGLGFSREDRNTNVLRIGYVCHLLSRNDIIAIAAAISPYRDSRDQLGATIPDFLEIFVDCPLERCIERDVKGLYARAIAGELPNFTGISDPYEPPLNPALILATDQETSLDSALKVLQLLAERGYLQHWDLEAGKEVLRQFLA